MWIKMVDGDLCFFSFIKHMQIAAITNLFRVGEAVSRFNDSQLLSLQH